MSVKALLTEEIERRLNSMEDVAMCSPEDKSAVEDLSKLLDKYNELERIEVDHKLAIESREVENDLKREQMKEEKLDHIIKNSLTAVSVVGGFALTVWGTYKSIKFEETGTITTIMGRGFINKLLPKK